jgi:hypothetical protein
VECNISNIMLSGLVVCLPFLVGCSGHQINSQSATDLMLIESDLPPGWTVYLDIPKLFDSWPIQDRLKAQQRGYIDGHQRTFVNGSDGIITLANSIYLNVDMRELYLESLIEYANSSREVNGRTETLEQLSDPRLGQYSFAYKATVPNNQTNISYYELFLAEKNVMTHLRCFVQEVNIEKAQEFCLSLLASVDKRIQKVSSSPSKSNLKDTLIIVPVEEFLPNKGEISSEWAILEDRSIKRSELPQDLSAVAGPGQFIEGHLRVFKKDTKNSITVVNSLYAKVVNENTFGSEDNDVVMNFTRITSVDLAHTMKLIEGRQIGERTWWINLTRPDNTRYVNVIIGLKNFMAEVICDMASYNDSMATCDYVAQLIAEKLPSRAIDYLIQPQSPNAITANASAFMPPYDSAKLIQKATSFLAEQYSLPNGSVGTAKITEYNATLLSIDHSQFHMTYLLIKVNSLKETYGNKSLDDVIKEECLQNSPSLGISYQTCMERAPGIYNQLYFPSYMCPINMTPIEITGSVGPGGRCIKVEDENVGPTNQDILKELSSGYRYRYLGNVLKLEPYGGEADDKVQNFNIELMAANWTRQIQPVLEVKFNINMNGLGCYPFSIRVYFDETLNPVTANEEVICVD